jgi:hypothetical protein
MQKYNPDELALLFQKVFATEDGKAVLHVLTEKFRRPPLLPLSVTDGNALSVLTFYRVGEENVIRYIDALISKEIGK